MVVVVGIDLRREEKINQFMFLSAGKITYISSKETHYLEARTRHMEVTDEGDCSDGSGCENGRGEADERPKPQVAISMVNLPNARNQKPVTTVSQRT